MTQPSASQPWDTCLYKDKHAFVWEHGASVVELLTPRPGERILDLGCGTGHLTATIAAAGAEVIGIDHAAEMVAEARAAHPGLTFLQGDARAFSVPEPLDAVFSNAALHWIQEPRDVIRCVQRALKPGGRFVAEMGGRGNVQRIEAAMLSAARDAGSAIAGPLWFFPGIAEYAALLEEAALEVRYAVLFDRPTPLDGAEGMRNFVAMFGRRVLDSVAPERREEFLQAVEDKTRPVLFDAGRWTADYRRLRFSATRMD